jgi:hypothetical protein
MASNSTGDSIAAQNYWQITRDSQKKQQPRFEKAQYPYYDLAAVHFKGKTCFARSWEAAVVAGPNARLLVFAQASLDSCGNLGFLNLSNEELLLRSRLAGDQFKLRFS